MVNKKSKTADAEKMPKYSVPKNLGLVTNATLQGYNQNVTIDKLNTLYLRQGFCYRIVNKRSGDLFDAGFKIVNNDPLGKEITTLFNDIDFMSEMKQAQKYAYLHGVGFLLLGWRDSAELDEEPQNVTGIDYAIPVSMNKVKKAILDENKDSDTYGDIIALEISDKGQKSLYQSKRIHYKRFLTITYDAFDNNPLGYSQVTPAYNYLETLENLLWSVGQAYYRYGSPLHFLKVAGATTEKLEEFDKKLPDINALTRLLGNEKYTLETHQQSPADPKPFFDITLTACCATLGIPKQIVEGTSAGVLTGSETNLRDYYSDLAQEQVLVIEDKVREFITSCQDYNIFKNKGEYIVDWNPQFEQTELEKAQTAKTWAEAYQAMIIAGVPQETIDENIPTLSTDAIFPTPTKALLARKSIKREGELHFLETKILRTLRAIFTPKKATTLVPDSSSSLSRLMGMFRKDGTIINQQDEADMRDNIDHWVGENEVRIKAVMPQIVLSQLRAGGIERGADEFDMIYQRVYQNNFNYLKGFNEDLRKDLSGVLSNGLQNSWTKDMMTNEFKRVIGDMTDARLSSIVRTETNRAINEVENQLARVDGMRWKTWVTMGDERVRETHIMAELQGTIPIDQPFNVGGDSVMYPPADVNCRCWVEYS